MATNRALVFAEGEVYHIFNRGVERRPVFMNNWDFQRMMDAIWLYRYHEPQISLSSYLGLSSEDKKNFQNSLESREQSVALIAFCLMPNHFHFVLRQEKTDGVSRFASNISNSYTKYFNLKRKRVGPLFQGTFKAVLVETDEQLLHLTRYIHLNPVASRLIKPSALENYLWSSLPEYFRLKPMVYCDQKAVDNLIPLKNYREFVKDQADYDLKIGKIGHLIMEEKQ